MKVYTKTGDDGTTSLIGGERVSKADPRVEAYGTVDELSAHLALLADMMRCEPHGHLFDEYIAALDEIQIDLMTVEAMLAVGRRADSSSAAKPASLGMTLPESAIARLEKLIDTTGENLPPLPGFVIPGGHPIVSQSHVCRTVCRRAERATVAIPHDYAPHPMAGQYLNRLSDLLYVVGRKAVEILSVKETYWTP